MRVSTNYKNTKLCQNGGDHTRRIFGEKLNIGVVCTIAPCTVVHFSFQPKKMFHCSFAPFRLNFFRSIAPLHRGAFLFCQKSCSDAPMHSFLKNQLLAVVYSKRIDTYYLIQGNKRLLAAEYMTSTFCKRCNFFGLQKQCQCTIAPRCTCFSRLEMIKCTNAPRCIFERCIFILRVQYAPLHHCAECGPPPQLVI